MKEILAWGRVGVGWADSGRLGGVVAVDMWPVLGRWILGNADSPS